MCSYDSVWICVCVCLELCDAYYGKNRFDIVKMSACWPMAFSSKDKIFLQRFLINSNKFEHKTFLSNFNSSFGLQVCWTTSPQGLKWYCSFSKGLTKTQTLASIITCLDILETKSGILKLQYSVGKCRFISILSSFCYKSH